ncbi:unnamed protein product [Malus baccata var. baccata]
MCTTSRAATCGAHSTESHTLTQVHYLPVIFVSAQHTYESKHQSPHQLAKAKEKEPLKECRKIEGDADDLPYPTDYVDRYVSARSFWLLLQNAHGLRKISCYLI